MKAILHHFLRIDARGLGLFRILMGLSLLGDLRYRWEQAVAFYSNEGVLPNHNHLFNLKNDGRFVWSVLHAFSTAGEAKFALAVIGLFYVLYTLGLWTRVFSVLSLVSLVSLTARNTLAEGPGDWLAIALLFFTAFLPLGSRWSLDAYFDGASRARFDDPRTFNDRSTLPSPELVAQHHLPGWSPRSIAALGVLVQLALVMLALAMQQQGAWRDGTALSKALHVDLFASPLGFAARDNAALGALTRVVYYAQWLVPVLLVVPVVRGLARGAAATLLVVHGLTYGLLTNLGLFGWVIAASAALVIADETWERWATRQDPERLRTVVYDDDCGVCTFACALLKQLDTRNHLVFQGNDTVAADEPARPHRAPTVTRGKLLAFDPKKRELVEKELPKAITPELVETTVVVVRPDGSIATRGEAIAEVLLALPAFGPLGMVLRVPGIRGLAGALYDAFAKRRTAISAELGLAACGAAPVDDVAAPALGPASPARVARFSALAAAREVGALVFLASVAVSTTHHNELGFRLPDNGPLESISWWSRTPGRWDVMTPEPPSEQGRLFVDALVRSERSIDLLTGAEPVAALGRPFELGHLWARYADAIWRDQNKGYQSAFRSYLAKRGPAWEPEGNDDRIVGVDAYWGVGPATGETKPTLRRLFRHGRGGKTFDEAAPATPSRRAPQLARPIEPSLHEEGDSTSSSHAVGPDDPAHAPSPGQQDSP